MAAAAAPVSVGAVTEEGGAPVVVGGAEDAREGEGADDDDCRMEATPDPAAAGPYSAVDVLPARGPVVPCTTGAATCAAASRGWERRTERDEDEDEEDEDEEEDEDVPSLPFRASSSIFVGVDLVSIYLRVWMQPLLR